MKINTVGKFNLIVDDRERNSKLFQLLTSSTLFDTEVRRISRGDYLINNWLLVERKEVNDLIYSIISSRLFLQAQKLIDSPFRPLFLIEGSYQSIQSNINRSAILGALATVSLIYGITTIKVQNAEESFALLTFAAQQGAKQQKQEYIRMGYRPKSSYHRQLFILCSGIVILAT